MCDTETGGVDADAADIDLSPFRAAVWRRQDPEGLGAETQAVKEKVPVPRAN